MSTTFKGDPGRSSLEDLIWAATLCALHRGDRSIEPNLPRVPIWPEDETALGRRKRLVLHEIRRALAQDQEESMVGPDEDQLLLMLDGLPSTARAMWRAGGLPDLIEGALRRHVAVPTG